MDKLKEIKNDSKLTEAAKRRIINKELDKINKENRRFIDPEISNRNKKIQVIDVNKALRPKRNKRKMDLLESRLTTTNYEEYATQLTTESDFNRFETTYDRISRNIWNLTPQEMASRIEKARDPNFSKEEYLTTVSQKPNEIRSRYSKKSSISFNDSGSGSRTLAFNKKRAMRHTDMVNHFKDHQLNIRMIVDELNL